MSDDKVCLPPRPLLELVNLRDQQVFATWSAEKADLQCRGIFRSENVLTDDHGE